MDPKGPLPPGYEAKWDHGQKAYFYINHRDKTTTWVDPRTKKAVPSMAAQYIPRTPHKATTQRNQNDEDLSKLIVMFPDCPDEILQSIIRSCENNLQSAIQQCKMLGFRESGQSVSPLHSSVQAETSQPKQHTTPTRKPTQSNESYSARTYGADSGTDSGTCSGTYGSGSGTGKNGIGSGTGTGTGASTSSTDRTTINPFARFVPQSGHTEDKTAHLVTDTSSNQRVTDPCLNQRATDTSSSPGVTNTSSNQRVTVTSSSQRVTDIKSSQRVTDTSSTQGTTSTSSMDTSYEKRRTDNKKRSPKKTVSTSSIKDKTHAAAPTHISIANGRNRSLQSGPDPTLRLSEHVAVNGHDPSLVAGPDLSRCVGSAGWVGADPSLCSRKRLFVTNI